MGMKPFIEFRQYAVTLAFVNFVPAGAQDTAYLFDITLKPSEIMLPNVATNLEEGNALHSNVYFGIDRGQPHLWNQRFAIQPIGKRFNWFAQCIRDRVEPGLGADPP